MHQPFVAGDILSCGTIGIATCLWLRQAGINMGMSLVGVKMSGEFAQMQLVRK